MRAFAALRRLGKHGCPPGCVIALVVGVLLAVLWLSTWQRIEFERAQAVEAANRENANLAIAYEENADNALGDVEQILRLVETEYVTEGTEVAEAMGHWQLDRVLVRGLAIEGPDGRLVVGTGEALDAREWLRNASAYHRAHAGYAMRIARPEPLMSDGNVSVRVAMSRRVVTPDGTYGGTVLAVIDPGFFTHFFRRVDAESDGVVQLVGRDGIALARQAGKVTRFLDDMRSSTLFAHLRSAPAGSFVSRGRHDGIRRLMSYRTMANYPLVVLVGSGLDRTLAPVRERARLYLVLAAIGSGFAALVALALLGAIDRHRRDFEALRATEAKLRETAARKEAITDSMAGGVLIMGMDGTLLSVNRSACAMYGYGAGEMQGMNIRELVAERDRAKLESVIWESLRQGPGIHHVEEILGLRRDGSTFDTEGLGSVVQHDADPSIVVIVHDISERKATERALRRKEALYRATFDQALLGIVHTGMDGRFMRVNRRACEMLGYTEAEMLALGYRDVTHPEDLVESVQRHETLLADPAREFEFQVTRRFLRKDGSILWALASVGVIRGEDGMPDFFLTMVQDITELRRVEEMKNEFVSTVSHELRSPLTSIRGSLGLLVGGVAGSLPKPAHDLAVIGERNCERLIRLVNDILDTERMESGRMCFELEAADLRGIVSRTVESLQGLAVGRDIRIRTDVPKRPVVANVDRDRMAQVITNLVSNALKFSPTGGTVEVALSSTADGHARIEVRDHGPGIPKEFEGRIFQRFAQADSSSTRAHGGTGLGLHIAKGIVERLGGSIGYVTKIGEGTTFVVELAELRQVPTPRAEEAHA